MGMADEMRGPVQEIQASHEARADRVAAIRQETAEMLKGFRRHLRAMAAELRVKGSFQRSAVGFRFFLVVLTADG